MKIKLIFDSTIGISKKETESLGAAFVPITLTYNGEDRYAGVDIDDKFLSENMTTDDTVKTAAVTLGTIESAYRDALKEADHAVYISLSKGLSGSNKNAAMVAKEDEFKGKVTVIESNYIAPVLKEIAPKFIEVAKTGDLDKLVETIEYHNKDIIVFFTPGSLSFLHKGGRISKVQYVAGSLLKVQPIMTYSNDNLTDRDVIKGKKIKGAIEKMVEAFEKEVQKDAYKENGFKIGVLAYGKHRAEFEEATNKLADKYNTETYDSVIDAAIMAHTGPEAYGLAILKK